MREIEFRGRNNGKWFYGALFINRYLDEYHIIAENSAGLHSELQVKPETVGEYTGLKDKNGKKIFEGDIVIDSDGNKDIICFDDGKFGSKDETGQMWAINMRYIHDLEVIGTIHDKENT